MKKKSKQMNNNVEKDIPIEIIASIFENKLLVENIEDASNFFKEQLEFITFITNNEVSIPNYIELELIKEEILRQHEDLKIYKHNTSNINLTIDEIRILLSWYRGKNGLSKKIKPMEKEYKKTLKIQS